MTEIYLSVGEAARFLGVSTATMQRWDREHRGPPCVRAGFRRDRRYSLSALQEFKESGTARIQTYRRDKIIE